MKIFLILGLVATCLCLNCELSKDGHYVPVFFQKLENVPGHAIAAPSPKATIAPPWAKFIKPTTTTTEVPTTTTAPLSEAEAFLQAWFAPKTAPQAVTTTTEALTTTTVSSSAKKTTKAVLKKTKKPLPWMIEKLTTTTTTTTPIPSPELPELNAEKQMFISRLFAALSSEIANVTGQSPLPDAVPPSSASSILIPTDKVLFEKLIVLNLLKPGAKESEKVVSETETTTEASTEPVVISPDEHQQLLALLGPALMKALNKSLIVNASTSSKAEVDLTTVGPETTTVDEWEKTIAILKSFQPEFASILKGGGESSPSTTEDTAEEPTSAEELTILTLLKPNVPIDDTTESPQVSQLIALLKSFAKPTTEATSEEAEAAPESPTDTPVQETKAPTDTTTKKSTITPKTKKTKVPKVKKTTTATSAPETTPMTIDVEVTTEASDVIKLAALLDELKALLARTTPLLSADITAVLESSEETTSGPNGSTKATEVVAETTALPFDSDNTTTEASTMDVVSKLVVLLNSLVEPTTDTPASAEAETTPTLSEATSAPETEEEPAEATTETSDVSKLAAILKALLASSTEGPSTGATEDETAASLELTEASEESATTPEVKTKKPKKPTSAPETTEKADTEATTESFDVAKLAALLKSLLAPSETEALPAESAEKSASETTTAESSTEESETTAAPPVPLKVFLQTLLNKTVVAPSSQGATTAPGQVSVNATNGAETWKKLLVSYLLTKNITKNVTISKSSAPESGSSEVPSETKEAAITVHPLIAILDDLSPITTTESPATQPASEIAILKDRLLAALKNSTAAKDIVTKVKPDEETTKATSAETVKASEYISTTSSSASEIGTTDGSAPSNKDMLKILIASILNAKSSPVPEESAETTDETTSAAADKEETTTVGIISLIKSLLVETTTTSSDEIVTNAVETGKESTTESLSSYDTPPKTKEDVINLLVAALGPKADVDTKTEAKTTLATSEETNCNLVLQENGPLLTVLLQKILCGKKDADPAA